MKKVLAYHAKNGRHTLLWRKTRDSYRILVSEMMLQQTQVSRVIPFYRNFLKQFPTANALSQAPLVDVLRAWSGLGYNRRAKFLHEAAKAICTRHPMSCKLPHDYLGLRKLPGVGDYTAKAVRTFAYNEKEVMLETNIRTVLIHEFFAVSRTYSKVGDEKLVPILAEALKYVDSPREWYAALMDYGTHLKQTHGNATRKSRTYAKQSKFQGSLRQVRGAILKQFVATGAVNVSTLMKTGRFDQARLEAAHKALKREGLVH